MASVGLGYGLGYLWVGDTALQLHGNTLRGWMCVTRRVVFDPGPITLPNQTL